MNTTTKPLSIVYYVPILDDTFPAANRAAFLAYKNCRYHTFNRDFSVNFKPYVKIGDSNLAAS